MCLMNDAYEQIRFSEAKFYPPVPNSEGESLEFCDWLWS
jgi:hypothetical protein